MGVCVCMVDIDPVQQHTHVQKLSTRPLVGAEEVFVFAYSSDTNTNIRFLT